MVQILRNDSLMLQLFTTDEKHHRKFELTRGFKVFSLNTKTYSLPKKYPHHGSRTLMMNWMLPTLAHMIQWRKKYFPKESSKEMS